MNRIWTLIVAAPSVPAVAWAQERPWEAWGMHPMWGIWGMWGIGMMLFAFVFWGLVIAGLVIGLRWLLKVERGARPDAALDVLRQRYARGEISKQEFEEKKRDLG